jgi:TonB-linked SusC/RagA family outer membrane protein
MLSAQETGTVQGTVTDAGTGYPIAGAQVTIADSRTGWIASFGQPLWTDDEGSFAFDDVAVGQVVVRARLIGYSSMEVRLNVVAGQTAVANIALRRSVIQLDAVVVTGTGGNFERKQVGNTIATVQVEDVANAPVATFSELLQGREPSFLALSSGGLAGEGMRIRIRGSNSLSMSNEPVVYLDGIRVDNAGSNVAMGGGSRISRLDDINPEAIERIEILKGAAAGTLYGSEASSGVIQIFTKRGRPGSPRFGFRLEQGISRYPDVFEPNAGFARTPAQAASMSEMFRMEIEPYQIVERTFLKDIFETGRSQSYSADVTGGSPDVLYYVSGRLATENGPLAIEKLGPATDYNRRAQATASITFFPRERLSIRVVGNYADMRFEAPHNNNWTGSPFFPVMYGKPELSNCDWSSLDTTQTFGETTPVCTGIGNAAGNIWGATARNASQVENRQDAEHFNGSVTASYGLTSALNITTTLGVDAVNELRTGFTPYGVDIDRPPGEPPAPGFKFSNYRHHREITFDARLSWEKRFGNGVSSEFVVGTQGFFANDHRLTGGGWDFPVPGLEVIDALDEPEVSEEILSKVNVGIVAQEQIGFFDVAYLTIGGRWDRNSTFGEDVGAAFYPKASVSVVPSDIAGWDSSLLSTFRVRAAYGTSGLQPGAFDEMTTYGPAPLASGSGVQPHNLGNPDLKPERSSEIELGAELGLFENRASLDLTRWDRSVTDGLIAREFAAGGFLRRQLFNIGRVDAHGWELKLDGLFLDRENISVQLFANAAYLSQKTTDMGGAPPLKVGGSYQRHRQSLVEGYAPGAFFGAQIIPVCSPDVDRTCYTPGSTVPFDWNQDGFPDSESEFRDSLAAHESISLNVPGLRPMLDDEDDDADLYDHHLGKPIPDWQGAFGADITLWNNLQINTLFEYRTGNYGVANLTGAFRRSHGVGRNVRETAEVEATLLNPATQNDTDARFDAATKWGMELLSLWPYSGLNLVEKADFVRWRELSLTYAVPATLARRIQLNSLSVSFTARNLALFTSYERDPESNQVGRCGGGGEASLDCNFMDGSDAFALPLPRRFVFSIRLGF